MASKPMSSERLAEQKCAVEKALSGRMLNKYDGVMLSGDNSKIMKAVMGEFRNTHRSVFLNFLGKKTCEHCNINKCVERAHIKRRPDIVKEVLDELHPDPNVPINFHSIMKEFVMKHFTVGVWMLCKKCHKELG
jgi:hypothetical protein